MLLSLLSLVIGSRQMNWHFDLQPFFVNSQYWNVMLYHPMEETMPRRWEALLEIIFLCVDTAANASASLS